MSRRQALAGLGLLSGAAFMPRMAFAADDNNLVIPTLGGVWEQFWRETIVPEFQKHTKANITLDVGNGRTWGANLRAAGVNNPPYSILVVNEVFGRALRKEGFFEKLDLSKLPNYNDLYKPAQMADGWGATAVILPIGIGYRTDLVKTPPKSWKDLWNNPEFAGKVGLYTYANSAGKMELLLASKLFGKDQYDVDAGFAALKKLRQTIQVDFNLSTALASGEITVAPFDFDEITRLRKKGLPVDCVVPEEGLIMFDNTINICAHSAGKDLAYQYANFILSPEMQDLLMRQFYVSPSNKKVVVPDDLKKDIGAYGADIDKILSWDWDFLNQHDSEFAERWTKTFS
jgi:putative spermidine/putrescine transport system substrate-binding protein